MALEQLGRALQYAFQLNRAEAARWAEAIIANNTGAAVQALTTAYMRGRVAGYQVHGSMLGAPNGLPERIVRAWQEAGNRFATGVTSRARRTFDEHGNVDRVFVRSYASALTRQTTWAGQDDVFKDLGRAFDVEFKTWVRAWPRTTTRDWHDELEDGKAIPLDDLFTLPDHPKNPSPPGTQVYGPRDWERAPEAGQWMNCGHALAFETRPTAENTENPRGSTIYDPRNQPRHGTARDSQPQWSPAPFDEAATALAQTAPEREWTPAQLDAVKEYTELDYRSINEALRGVEGATLDAAQAQTVQNIDAALAGRTMPVDAELWRGYTVPVANIGDDPAKLVGTVLRDPAFMSTDINKATALLMAEETDAARQSIVLTIRGRAGSTPGAYVQAVSGSKTELEFLMPRGTPLRVVEASFGSDPAWGGPHRYLHVVAEVMGDR